MVVDGERKHEEGKGGLSPKTGDQPEDLLASDRGLSDGNQRVPG